MPALADGSLLWPRPELLEGEDDEGAAASSHVVLFAAPKRRVTVSIRKKRMMNKWMQTDHSVYRCPTCNAFKKRHIALHCAKSQELCGLGQLRAGSGEGLGEGTACACVGGFGGVCLTLLCMEA
jgi:hypothetical protein